MTKQLLFEDWFVISLIALMWVAATVFLFKNQTSANFGIWAGVCSTMTAAYHYIMVKDQKTPDCCRDH